MIVYATLNRVWVVCQKSIWKIWFNDVSMWIVWM